MPDDRFAQLRASLAALAVVGLLATIAVVEGPFVNVRTPPVLSFCGSGRTRRYEMSGESEASDPHVQRPRTATNASVTMASAD